MIHHYVKTGLLLAVLVVFSITLQAQVISPFSSIYQTSQRGGIVFLSNSALGCSANPPAATGTCQTSSQETPLLGTTRNDDFLSAYIDIDGDATTFMSSSDRLDLASCSRISKAFLFWGASGTSTTNFNQVKLKVNTGTYQTVTATASTVNVTGINSYHCYADVTSLLSPTGINDRITVANIISSEIGLPNSFGSWNLVVVYKNDAMSMRQLTVFNGLAHLSATTPTANIQLSGFLTPTTGAVGFEVGVYSHDGDRGIMGDNIMFNGNLTFLPMTDVLINPAGDAMNSTVSNNGVANAFRNPLLANTMGSDADIYAPTNLLNAYLANSATTATVQLITTSDNYLVQALTSSIDSYEPDLRATMKARDVNGGALNPGDIVEYRVRGANFGTDVAMNTFITHTLDANVNYITNSTLISFGQNPGTKTDASGDDQVDYNAATRVLRVRIGNGANASNGGTLAGSFTGADSTVVTFSVAVTQSCLKLSCNNTINAQAFISGTGSTFITHTYTNASTPGTSDSFSCSILGTTSSVVTTTSCSTPTANSNSPVCSGANLLLNASADAEATYLWTGPSSFTSSVRNPTLTNISTAQSGLYTVTLTIPSTTCSAIASTNATVISCPPTAVNDFTNTTVNVPVSGNSAANDFNGVPFGTFSILNQPANGTVTINASTGVYSFTPATGFTGVTTATYQLCNGNPTVCATANITFTVYSTLVANPDVINTTPTASVTGNLSANDSGTATGVTYNVSFTQVSAATGTLTVNSATGQYTFVPNAAFNGTAQTTYTTCNVTVNPPQCASTTITINVRPNPVPANDGTTTVVNTTVTGNAALNDIGATGGTFAIVAQPVNGTISINATTGVYTFSPATSFTGVTTATYNLCNGAPVTCSTAVITITVYPALVANPDVINTTPATATTGSLLTNDTGIVPGANYSVSVVQLPTSTGTILVNPATGQYTFTPNVLFTGVAQTTYNVCNTSVNPQQCSSTTITINVSNLPAATNDATATVVNTPVSGNAGANDSGTFGGTFTFGTISSPTGTFTGNSLTGQYSYTPANNFTGTTSVTYTLCNLNSPPCSTASILFTVYPLLVANPDAINTTPSVTATGSLLANDTGVTPGAVYSVSSTSLSPATGTLTVNPANGTYTFIPNPNFTGTAQTSYTVCNISVNPQQCSSASISISVIAIPVPVAVNDETLTIMGTPVSGNVSTNDSNTSGGTFTFNGPSPITGNLTGNSATGDYTFTPYSGFSGVTYASYTVCTNPAVPCATALITFTVYPTLEAKGDVISTYMNVPANGNLKTNDVGTFSGGSYSLAVSALQASVGVITTDAAGQYTFTPATGFLGSSATTYTLTQYSGSTELQSSIAGVTVVVREAPSPIGVAKSISHVTYNTNGTFYLTYKVVVKNYSNQTISAVAVNDDLSATFPLPTTYTVTVSPYVSNAAGSQLTPESNYTGSTTNVFLTTAASSSLAAGRADTILFTVKVDPHNYQLTYNNAAQVYGSLNNATVNDASVNGLNPDADGNGNPGDDSSFTPFNYNLVKIGLAKYVGDSENDGNGCYNATFKFTVKNYGAAPIYNIQLFDNLNATFGTVNYSVVSPITSANGHLTPDNLYNGSSNVNLLANNSTLGIGQTDTVFLHVNYCSGEAIAFANTAIVYGNSVPGGGFIGFDISTSGLNPDPNGNGNPSDTGEDAVTSFTSAETFQIPQGFSPNGDDKNPTFEIKGLKNYPQTEVTILSRWGNVVYNKKNYDNSWDGKSNEGLQFSGNDLPEGTYYYIVDLNNGKKPLKGFVYLSRASK